MHQMKSFHVEIWRTECGEGPVSRSTNYFAIRADLTRPMRQKKSFFGEDDLTNQDGSPIMEEDSSYLGYIWFLLEEPELRAFASGNSGSFQDGMHIMDTSGDDCMFYDNIRYQGGMSRSNGPNGKVEVPYFNATIPIFWRRMMLKVANRIWRGLEKAQAEALAQSRLENMKRWCANGDYQTDYAWSREAPKVTIKFDLNARERIIRLYGQGHGQVTVDIGGNEPEKTKEQLAKDLQDPKFVQQYENKLQICRNMTLGFHQTARLYLRLDDKIRDDGRSPGFYFECFGPGKRSRCSINGAVLPHYGDGNEAHWSSHT